MEGWREKNWREVELRGKKYEEIEKEDEANLFILEKEISSKILLLLKFIYSYHF